MDKLFVVLLDKYSTLADNDNTTFGGTILEIWLGNIKNEAKKLYLIAMCPSIAYRKLPKKPLQITNIYPPKWTIPTKKCG